MIQADEVRKSAELYLTIGPFLIHNTWKQGEMDDQLDLIVRHYAKFLISPAGVDHNRTIHEIPLYSTKASPGAINASNWAKMESELRMWTARQARKQKGFMCHAAGVIHKGKCWLLPGRSGVGKSTLALKLAPKCDLVLSDEVCITLPTDTGWKLWGTPFYGTGEQGITGPGGALEAIIFPHRERTVHIEQLDTSAALALMMRAIVIPDKSDAASVLDDVIALLGSCRLFKAGFGYRSSTSEVYDAIIKALSD